MIVQYELHRDLSYIQVTGAQSILPLAHALTHPTADEGLPLTHLVVLATDDDARRFQEALLFFNPKALCHILPAWDSSPYSGLEPSSDIRFERCAFLYAALNFNPNQILIASALGLSQATLPPALFKKNILALRAGNEIPPNISSWLKSIGYQESPVVEDMGTFAWRGNILDVFSPQHTKPLRLELFGDIVESIRFFSVESQLSDPATETLAQLIPCREALLDDESRARATQQLRQALDGVGNATSTEILRALSLGSSFDSLDFFIPYLQESFFSGLDFISGATRSWIFHSNEIQTVCDHNLQELKAEQPGTSSPLALAPPSKFYCEFTELSFELLGSRVDLNTIAFDELSSNIPTTHYASSKIGDFLDTSPASIGKPDWIKMAERKLSAWISEGYRVLIGLRNATSATRLNLLLSKAQLKVTQLADEAPIGDIEAPGIYLISRFTPENQKLPHDKLVILKDEDFFGKKTGRKSSKASERQEYDDRVALLSFSDLKIGDLVVHSQHGIGTFEGLKRMSMGEIESEFVQIGYRDKDKLYLPVFRMNQIQKYSGPSAHVSLDKLGGQSWEKTKVKVTHAVRDIAGDLIRLYAERSVLNRPPYPLDEAMIQQFENAFPFDETEDQQRAITEIYKDLRSDKPMDRLICGDVGFGKTEVAMRAAFAAASTGRQVVMICPTTVLSFQHYESLLRRFKDWPLRINRLNRFVPTREAKTILNDLREGKIDIIVGTHRLLSRDVVVKDLGLLIIDEEQKFGVTHKERLRKIKSQVDTLSLSATPIPRTLNLSLMGVRDLSLINSPPTDRLASRTYVTKWNEELIRKAVTSEVARGGQIYFIHNRIQSIYELQGDLRRILPQDIRIKVAHGQLPEDELEQTMIGFFKHEFDVLICTAIVESGMDVPKANTIFIDQPHLLGLSQLYQLRGRVGRSKERAYCYLLLPRGRELDAEAAERLRVIKENTALGSGIRIAHYDLELRGSGNILGEDQSGHIAAVGYELYMDLLGQAVAELKGETKKTHIDPEISLRIPALIPDKYIDDIRVRLAYYKAFSMIRTEEDFEKMEAELKDRFGEVPESVLNLLGISLIRATCSELGATDLSQGLKNITLTLSDQTPIKPEIAIQLSMRENKKYQLLPNNRLAIRINDLTWARVYDELLYLKQQAT